MSNPASRRRKRGIFFPLLCFYTAWPKSTWSRWSAHITSYMATRTRYSRREDLLINFQTISGGRGGGCGSRGFLFFKPTMKIPFRLNRCPRRSLKCCPCLAICRSVKRDRRQGFLLLRMIYLKGHWQKQYRISKLTFDPGSSVVMKFVNPWEKINRCKVDKENLIKGMRHTHMILGHHVY